MDCSGRNLNATAKFRTEADNAMEQRCCSNVNSNDKIYNNFLSERINNSQDRNQIYLYGKDDTIHVNHYDVFHVNK